METCLPPFSYRGQNAFSEESVDDGALAVASPAEEDDLHVVAAQHAADPVDLFAEVFNLKEKRNKFDVKTLRHKDVKISIQPHST